jgi:hypothetical protein
MKMMILLYHFMVRKVSTGDSQLDSLAAMLQKHENFVPYMLVLLRMKSELLKLK